jgi:nicotinamidase-related amidase
MQKIALLIIDMQNDFIHDKSILQIKSIKQNLTKFKHFLNKVRNTKIKIPIAASCRVFNNNVRDFYS